MANLPADLRILLLAEKDRLVNEAEVVATLAAEGRTELVRNQAMLFERLSAEKRTPTLVIADLHSTLTSTDSLDGYRDFVGAYHAASRHQPLALLMLNPPLDEWPGGSCIGWADLVTGYLTVRAEEPVDVTLLQQFVRRIRQESFLRRTVQ